MFVIVAYDISDDKRRTRLHKRLKDFGVPVQYSIFECELEKREVARMKIEVGKIVDRSDNIKYYFLCAACARKAFGTLAPVKTPSLFVVTDAGEDAGDEKVSLLPVYQYSLMAQVCDPQNLRLAWKRIKANRGCAGVDRITLAKFAKNASRNLAGLQAELLNGAYRPAPVRRVSIPKSGDGVRWLGIPTVRDRVAQQAVYLVLGAIWDPTFSEVSFAYRPGRSVGKALKMIERLRNRGFTWVVDADINGYFDNIDHELIIQMVAEKIDDEHILRLISLWLKAQAFDGKYYMERLRGVPQGGVISPLLANIYLDYMDKKVLKEDYRLVRYADDFVILCNDKAKAEQAVTDVKAILGELKLELNPEKSRITSFKDGFEFLGTLFVGKMRLPGKKARAKSKMRWQLPKQMEEEDNK